MLSRAGRDESPKRSAKPSARRRSPNLSDDDDDEDWPPRRQSLPHRPRGPAQRPYPREHFDELPSERPPQYSSPGSYSPPPRYRRSEPPDPQRRHRRHRTMDDGHGYSDRPPRGRDDGRKQTWHPGPERDRRDVDDFLPRRYRSTTSPPPGRRDRRTTTFPEPRRERGYSPSRDYDSRPRARHRDTLDERGRARHDVDDPYRRRRGRARSLDTEDRFRSRGSPRARSYGAGQPQPGRGQSTKNRFVKVAGDLPWGAFASSAFQAGASAAYKARADPGPWMGKKGTKVATAALGAAIVDTIGSGLKGGGKKKR